MTSRIEDGYMATDNSIYLYSLGFIKKRGLYVLIRIPRSQFIGQESQNSSTTPRPRRAAMLE
jgi:hypothetical protein